MLAKRVTFQQAVWKSVRRPQTDLTEVQVMLPARPKRQLLAIGPCLVI